MLFPDYNAKLILNEEPPAGTCARLRVYVAGPGVKTAIIQTDTDIRPHVQSLSSNVELVTAIANDLSYDDVFVYQLSTLAKAGDVLITISASGDSENVVRAAAWARDNGVEVIAFTGFDGGRTGGLATVHLHVEGDNYGVVEDAHQSLMHVLAQYLRQSRMSESVIAQRKF